MLHKTKLGVSRQTRRLLKTKPLSIVIKSLFVVPFLPNIKNNVNNINFVFQANTEMKPIFSSCRHQTVVKDFPHHDA
jgi:hypothetical protein